MHKILIVEDSTVQALALQELLEGEGLRVRHAPDGVAGVDLAQQWLPDAIVLDLNLPRMDGFQVCKELQGSAETSHIPIIVLTSRYSASASRQSLSLGAVEFIPKGGMMNAVLLETLRQMYIIVDEPN
jgi:CheY-like chemotaxis protein